MLRSICEVTASEHMLTEKLRSNHGIIGFPPLLTSYHHADQAPV